jgi:hypothetical protein
LIFTTVGVGQAPVQEIAGSSLQWHTSAETVVVEMRPKAVTPSDFLVERLLGGA